ncbi:AIPR family protein [Thalassospira lucentensis]|uniref:AIPR family protein n=1 Tax=Thalassospira lucentensis TaxID=168935 RepID=UPI00142E6682|nr:AIPR family protein [Thalassospira lucentensis]NIZ01619.1 AIPR family protein [Thalassospira lucentensis]
MDDPILKAYLKDFAKEFNISDLKEPDIFEYFSAYCVMFRDFSEHTILEDIVVGGGLDSGIDSLGLYLNDIPITTFSQVDEVSSRQKIDADFCFVQSKTSRNISAAEIGSFIQGIKEFFGEKYMPTNEHISEKRDLSSYVFEKSVKMRFKPRLHLYYCYAGTYKADRVIEARVSAGKDELLSLNLFSDVRFTFLDSNKLQERYQEVNLRIEREITINEYAALPPINGIRQAYLGVLPCKELIKLLSNSDGKLHKSLFNENVRDFLSRNPVNDEIEKTLLSTENQSRLAALNNGVTIVARDVRIVGKKFTLGDFQIVNGCQTSHIVFANQDKILSDTSLPVKIIEAEDRELVNEVVRATNRQTEVKDEAFVVLSDFHKKLERFFLSIDDPVDYKLVYERRKRQYSDSAYTSKNIVTLTFLTNSFVSCFLENPVDANDYYGVLLRRYNKDMYIDNHSMWPYLLSARVLKEVEKLCTGGAKKNLWKFRFIISLLLQRSFGEKPKIHDEKSQKNYTINALNKLKDQKEVIRRVKLIEKIIAKKISSNVEKIDVRNAHQDRKFVETLIQEWPSPLE